MSLHVVVEGITDEPVVKKVAKLAGWDTEQLPVIPVGGKPNLDPELVRYNKAANYGPWFVLRDLDNDSTCAGELRNSLLPQSARFMCFRLAVRSTEAWLMADSDTLSDYLHISKTKISHEPDFIHHAKDEMVNLARLSRKPTIQADMVPGPKDHRRTGKSYESRIIDYAIRFWRPEVARERSPSLARAILALRRMHEAWKNHLLEGTE